MTHEELLRRRWTAARLKAETCSPEEVVSSLAAVQAQDLPSALTAVAIRGPGRTAEVRAALDGGTLVRTHILRPTWHLLAAPDLRWMMKLTGPRIARSAGGRYRELGLTPEMRSLSRRLLEAALAEGPQTRAELKRVLTEGGVPTAGQALVFCLMDAELELLLCNGPRQGSETAYDLLDRRVPVSSSLAPDEAASLLARRYISGHGPATDRDFSWWSGLPLTEARKALESSRGPQLATDEFDGSTMWFDPRQEPLAPSPFVWLPAYDEYVIAFADRTTVLAQADQARAVSTNGIFYPVILVRGMVAGTWRATQKKNVWTVEPRWFGPPPNGAEAARKLWEAALQELRSRD